MQQIQTFGFRLYLHIFLSITCHEFIYSADSIACLAFFGSFEAGTLWELHLMESSQNRKKMNKLLNCSSQLVF